jgi:hypothetical protein
MLNISMKKLSYNIKILFLFFVILISQLKSFSQNAKLCNIEIKENNTKFIGNVVKLDFNISNKTNHTIDNIEFYIRYGNVYGDYITTKNYTFESGLFIDPIKPYTTQRYINGDYIKTDMAPKIFEIYITRWHATDGTYCKNDL